MRNRMMVTLDSLLDTRLSTINAVSVEAIPNILTKYFNRKRDDFDVQSDGILDMSLYNERYARRDIETLKGAVATAILDVMNSLIVNIAKGPWEKIEITVNFYPYDLTDEVKESLVDIIYETLNIKPTLTSISNELLTPDLLNTWDCYIAYDFLSWLNLQNETMKDTKIKTTCYYPMLLHGDGIARKPDEQPFTGSELERLNKLDPWDSIEIIYSSLVTVKALPVNFFSAIPRIPVTA